MRIAGLWIGGFVEMIPEGNWHPNCNIQLMVDICLEDFDFSN